MTDARMTRKPRRPKKEPVPEPPSEDVQEAIRRLRALEDQVEEGRAIYAELSDRIQVLRRGLAQQVGNLDEAKRAMRRHPDTERRIEARISALKAELRRKSERMEAIGQQNAQTRQLADRCRAWLESGGASVEALEAGMPIPARQNRGRGAEVQSEGATVAAEANGRAMFGGN